MTTPPPASTKPRRGVPADDPYFAQANTWAGDRQAELERSRRVAWIVAAVATVAVLCQALALAILLPLKTVVPYTLLVDRQTGFVQALKPLDAQLVSADRALTQSFLVQYVIAREGFDRDTVQADYRKVGLWSTGRARSEYVAAMQPTNPDSPVVRLGRGALVDVAVKSVTPLGDRSALVRYESRQRSSGSATMPAQSWVAVVRYRFSGEPMAVADRFINPLGFQVERYRRSQEALTPPAEQPAASFPYAGTPVPAGSPGPAPTTPSSGVVP